MSALCGVCSSQPSKYKCSVPTCSLRYCSVPCSKEHKRAHIGIDALGTSTTAPSSAVAMAADTQSETHVQHRQVPPMQRLAESTELADLLAKHPALKPYLHRIYHVSVNGKDTAGGGKGGRQRPKPGTTRPDGPALTLIEQMRESDDGRQEGLNAFVSLVQSHMIGVDVDNPAGSASLTFE